MPEQERKCIECGSTETNNMHTCPNCHANVCSYCLEDEHDCLPPDFDG